MVRTNLIQPIPLASEPVVGGVEAVVSGWGQLRHPGLLPAENLQFVAKRTLSNEECKAAHIARGNSAAADNIHPNTLCAGGDIGRGA